MIMIRTISVVLLVIVSSPLAVAAADYSDMYSRTALSADVARYKRFIEKLNRIGIRPHLTTTERRTLDEVRFDFKLPEPDDYPLDFYTYRHDGRPYVALPVLSIKVLEDLATAYAWIWSKGYSFDVVDIYAAMLQYKPRSAFRSGRYPPPLEALGIPSDALADKEIDALSLRFRNSGMAFILLHELGHILYAHQGYEGISKGQARANEQDADRFALDVMSRTQTIPMGAVIFFQAQVYSLPHPGQFTSEAEWHQYVRTEVTHPITTDRLQAMARQMNSAARRENRPAEADSLRYIATRLVAIASILEDPLLGRCIVAVAGNADPSTLRPRREVDGRQMKTWCTKDR